MAQLIVYPDPGPTGTTTQVARVYNSTGSGYTTTRNAASGTYQSNSEDPNNWCQNDTASGNTVSRVVILFDTSALGAGVTISSATVSGYGISNGGGNSESDSLNIYSSNPGSNTTIAATDFDYTKFGTTQYATSFAFSSWTTGAYNDISLNATGIAAISTTGITKFGIRSVKEVAATSPASGPCFVSASSANHAGTSQDPKLTINYTASSPLASTLALLGVG